MLPSGGALSSLAGQSFRISPDYRSSHPNAFCCRQQERLYDRSYREHPELLQCDPATCARLGRGCSCHFRQDLDSGVRRDARGLHGGAEHPDRQRLARRHSGCDRCRHRRRRLDLDLLSDRGDRRHSAEWLAGAGLFRPRLPADQCHPVPGAIRGMRLRANPAADDRAARSRDSPAAC